MRYLFPGSFDPPTKGHLDLIERASRMCDELLVAVMCNPTKKGCIQPPRRVELLEKCCSKFGNVKVIMSSDLLVNVVKENGVQAIIRGVRGVADYEVERDRAAANASLSGVDTLFLCASGDKAHVSSGLVREIMYFNGDVSEFVPEEIAEELK